MHGAQGSQRAAEFVDRSFTGMDVATTADNVARNPVGASPPVPFGQAFP